MPRWADLISRCVHQGVCVFTEVRVDCVMVYAVVIIKTSVSSVDVWSEKSNFRPTQSGQIRSQASSPKKKLVNERVKYYFIL